MSDEPIDGILPMTPFDRFAMGTDLFPGATVGYGVKFWNDENFAPHWAALVDGDWMEMSEEGFKAWQELNPPPKFKLCMPSREPLNPPPLQER